MKKCPECGTENPDDAELCVLCGHKFKESHKIEEIEKHPDLSFEEVEKEEKKEEGVKMGAPRNAGNIPNYLVGAILVTLFCCLPLGIVAIIKSAEVNSKLSKGDIEGAIQSSKMARRMIIFGIIAGLSVVFFYVLFIIITIISAAS